MNESQQPKPKSTRRTFLKASTAGAATAASATLSTSHALNTGNFPVGPREQFLMDRITFGRTPALVEEMKCRGYEGFLNWQLQRNITLPEDILDDGGLFDSGGAAYAENPLRTLPWRLDPYGIAVDTSDPDPGPNNPLNLTYPIPGGRRMMAHGPQCLTRGAWLGNHPLRWVMTDFFQNVHNTYIRQPYQYLYWVPFLKSVVHEHALGKYRDLVKASAQGSSMLHYLGQPASNELNPNENYARELMELHTVGAVGETVSNALQFQTFVEEDIAEVAEILTGWDQAGFDIFNVGPLSPPPTNTGDFFYNASEHSNGPPHSHVVSFTGSANHILTPKTYPGTMGSGQAEGEELILDLCAHPMTALFLSRRLVQWFLGDDYRDRFRDVWIRTASRFYQTDGDMKEVLAEMFNEDHFDELCPPTAPTTYHKVRRPLNKVIGLLRSLDGAIDSSDPDLEDKWYTQQFMMGQINGAWPAPNGYQPENEKWTGSLQPTIQFYYDALIGDSSTAPGTGNGLTFDQAKIDAIFAGIDRPQYAQVAAEYLVGDCLPANEVQVISLLLGPSHPGTLAEIKRYALFYVLLSPSYQFLC